MEEKHFLRGAKFLEAISDWEPLVIESGYSGTALAKRCALSLRHLQRHIRQRYGLPLGVWMYHFRMKHAYGKLSAGLSVKETAFCLAYKQVSHFSRHFKAYFGVSPSCVRVGQSEAEFTLLKIATPEDGERE